MKPPSRFDYAWRGLLVGLLFTGLAGYERGVWFVVDLVLGLFFLIVGAAEMVFAHRAKQ